MYDYAITVQPGQGGWSHGGMPPMAGSNKPVVAHTPDPADYHPAPGGGTTIPRATARGGPQGVDTTTGVVNIVSLGDHSPPISVDMEKISAQTMSQALAQAHGDPVAAFAIASGAMNPPSAPQVQPGAAYPVQDTVSLNPSIKKRKDNMPVPQTIGTPAPVDTIAGDPQHGQIQQAPPAPTSNGAAQPDASLAPIVAQLMGELQQLKQAQAPPQITPPPQQQDPALVEVLTQLQQTVVDQQREMDALRNSFMLDKKASAKGRRVMREEEIAQEEIEPGEEELALPNDTQLSFITDPPSKPGVVVIFDLDKGGKHQKRFHHVCVLGKCLSLIFDSRFDGDQFIPPTSTGDDPPIILTFPQHGNQQVKVWVPDSFNQRIGCLDILNFIMIDNDEQAMQHTTQPVLGEVMPSDILGGGQNARETWGH